MPGVGAARAPAVPEEVTRSISSSSARLASSATGSSVAATMSMSLTLSAWRRIEPASSTSRPRRQRASRPARRVSPISIARGSSTARRERSGGWPLGLSSAASMLSSNFGPSPSTAAQPLPSAASRSASSESTPSSACSSRARFGPRPGRRVIAISPGGNFARSRSAAGIVAGLGERQDLLLQGLADARAARWRGPARASAATDTVASRTALAAVR